MKLGPYDLDQIYTGDARELAKAIPDESVDLIFTDPVYQNIDDYRWLAETAARVLRLSGHLLVWSTVGNQYKVHPVVSNLLNYRWTFTATMHGQSNRLMGFHIFTKSTPLMWFSRDGQVPSRWIMDTISKTTGYSDLPQLSQNHDWQKVPDFIAYYLEPFCTEVGITLDPFAGGGTVPAVCKMLGRHYLAFEIDSDIAERARQRVEMTQPPLLIPEPEQVEMFAEVEA